jgi:type II secretory pathway pseudopilin PulG
MWIMAGSLARMVGNRTGFRFVHLLVIVAIVAFLIALMIPAIERWRQQANLALCKEHLREIGVALIDYGKDNAGTLPVSPTVENPHSELVNALNRYVKDSRVFYCPAERQPGFAYSSANLKSGIIGYFYYSAENVSPDKSLSKFLREGVSWPRELNLQMDPKTWIMSDSWFSAVPTAHPGYRKGINYLMIDGSVQFVSERPRQQFH